MTNAFCRPLPTAAATAATPPDNSHPEEELDAIMLAAVQAPSARNTQPWHFSIVQDAALLKEFSDDYNRLQTSDPGRDILFFGAPTWCLSPRPLKRRRSFRRWTAASPCRTWPWRRSPSAWAASFSGRPREVLISEKGPRYAAAFGFPEGYTFAIAIALGEPTATKEAHVVREGMITRV